MNLTHEMLADDIVKVELVGRLDAAGSDEIGLALTAEAATNKRGVIIDLSGVDFLASIGIRLLLTTARAQKLRGGKVVLLNPRSMVRDVLHATGCDTLIDTFSDLGQAQADVAAALSRADA